MFKKYDEYLEIVLLIRKTTQIEAILLELGAKGGDLWSKSDSVRHILSNDVMVKILHIAIVRNHILCGRLEVENMGNAFLTEENKQNQIHKLIDECDDVLEILYYQGLYEIVKKKVSHKLEQLHYYDNPQKIVFSDGLKNWINALMSGNIENLNSVLDEEKMRRKELQKCTQKYVVKKQAKIFGKIMAGLTIAVVLYFLLGFGHD